MRAVVHDRYGPPDVLRVEEVERPVPKDDEVLVKIRAAAVGRADCGFRAADPFIVRGFTGLRRPKRRILGSELAGEVEARGAAVSGFAVGDHVFGTSGGRFGAHAEFVCVRESAGIAHKPTGMSFEEAAAVCDGALKALACLRRADLYDVVFDAVAKHSFRRCRGSLGPGGAHVATDLGFLWHVPLLVLLTSRMGDKKVLLPLPRETKKDVLFLKELIEAGKYRAVIDRCYPLEQAVEATTYVETGQKTGNVVLTAGGRP